MMYKINIAKYFGVSLILFLLSLTSKGQSTDIKFKRFTSDQGLSQVTASCITQDNRNFIWIGTQDGLNKFDGYKFTVFKNDRGDSLSLPNNSITGLVCDQKNRLWVASEQGLSYLDLKTEKFHAIHFNQHKTTDQTKISNLCSNGNYLFASINSRFLLFIDINNPINIKPIPLPKSSEITSLFSDNNKLWIGTNGNSLLCYDIKSNKITDSEISSFLKYNNLQVTAICKNRTEIFLGTNNGVYLFDKKSKFKKHINVDLLYQPIINTIKFDSFGDLWIGTSMGLLKVDLISDKLLLYQSNYFDPNSLSNNKVFSIFEDKSAVIWIGTENGLNNFDRYKKNFKLFAFNQANNYRELSNVFWSILPIDKENTWAGNENGIVVLNNKSGSFFTLPLTGSKGEKNLDVFSFQKEGNTVWVGTNNGLFTINTENYKFQEYKIADRIWEKLKKNKIFCIKIIENNLWLGTSNGLFILERKNKKVYDYQKENLNVRKISNSNIRTIVIDKNNTVWLGTDGGGLLKIANKKNIDALEFETFISNIKDNSSISNNSILSILPHNNILWLGTFGGGLNLFNTKSGKVEKIYTEKNGLSNNAIYGILMDIHNNLWISTNKGLSLFKPKTESFIKYFKEDGIQGNEFNTGAYAKGFNNEMFFGGLDGLTTFNTEKLKTNPIAPTVSITGIKIFNKEIIGNGRKKNNRIIPYFDTLYLGYKEKFISIEFSSLHFSSPQKNEFEYFLEGWDETWNYSGNNHEATYSNLEPGEYTFKVKGSNANGIWSKNEANLVIIIKPPFYKTWWFRFLIIAVSVGVIIIFYRRKMNSVVRKKRILQSLVEERTQKIMVQADEIKKQNKELEDEKVKIDKLLLNILPKETAEELKTKGKASARSYRLATVMFTDFVGFTSISQKLRPKELVSELDECFSEFDRIIDKYGLEKIKTIGDSYMCAGGVPIRNVSNPFDMVLAALEIQEYIKKRNQLKKEKGEIHWDLRIGINTGDLVAGVIGEKRFAFDIWGDTVNVANRLEANSEAGKVNISNTTYELVKDFFDCIHRGEVNTKNRGLIDMYFVNGIKPELIDNTDNSFPGKVFTEKLNLHLYGKFNYKKAEQQILKMLEENLPNYYYYHSVEHTIEVRNNAEAIAKQEKISDEDILMLKTAALFHDSGFLVQYDNNEEEGCKIARKILPMHGYTSIQIDIICRLIMATKIPQMPGDILEMIMCDADLDYLGTDSFESTGNKLKRELMWVGKIKTDFEWDKIQINFLKSHHYFTETSKRLKEEKKNTNLKLLMNDFNHL